MLETSNEYRKYLDLKKSRESKLEISNFEVGRVTQSREKSVLNDLAFDGFRRTFSNDQESTIILADLQHLYARRKVICSLTKYVD